MTGKLMKRLALITASLLIAVSVTACGLGEWNETKAKEFVTSALDANVKGKFKDYAKMTGQTEKEVKAEYDKNIKETVKGVSQTFGSESEGDLTKITQDLGKKTKYDVKSVKKIKKGFTVTIAYKPLTVFSNLNEELAKQITPEAIEAAGIDVLDEAATKKWATDLILDLMKEAVKNPTYGEKQTLTVNIIKNGKKYELSQEDFNKLRNALVYNDAA